MNQATDQAVVVVRELYKEFHRDELAIPVLMGTNLSVSRGEYLALMGPSGSGKTTLLNLIAGLDRPTSGQVLVAGEDLGVLSESALARWRSQNIGFIFQLYNLIPVLTAFENVELPLLLTHLNRRERAARRARPGYRAGRAGDEVTYWLWRFRHSGIRANGFSGLKK